MPEGFLVQEGLPHGFLWQSDIIIALCARNEGFSYSIYNWCLWPLYIHYPSLSSRWVRRVVFIVFHQFSISTISQAITLFSQVFNPLFLFQWADKQLTVLLDYDIAIQAMNYHLAFIGCMNHAVLAFIQSDIITYLSITSLILWEQGTEAAPAA